MTIARSISLVDPMYAVKLLFANGEKGFWYDPADMSTMYQDSAGTTPVTAAGQQVGKILDKSGNGYHATQSTSGNRPYLRNSGSLWYLEFDGSNSQLVTANVDLTGTKKITIGAGLRKVADAAYPVLCESFNASNVPSVSTHASSGTGSSDKRYALALTTLVSTARYWSATTSQFAAPITNVVTCQFDNTQSTYNTVLAARVNGAAQTLNDLTTGGPSGNAYFLNKPFYIGCRYDGSLPMTGYIYSLVLRSALTDGAQLQALEHYNAWRSGIAL